MSTEGEVRSRFAENARRNKEDGEEVKNKNNVQDAAQREEIRGLSEIRAEVRRELNHQLDPERLHERLWGKAQIQADTWSAEDLTRDQVSTLPNEPWYISKKTFKARESELTELMKNKHIATIYNVFVAILVILFASTVIHDIINSRSITFGLQLISWNFSRFHEAIFLWIKMMIFVVSLYFGYLLWAKLRATIEKNANLRDFVDKAGIMVVILFFGIFAVFSWSQARVLQLPFVPALAAAMEQIRLLLKMYTFLRINAPRTVQHKNTHVEPYFVPDFEKYIYYIFAPTLIYRDKYLRTSHIRWGFAMARSADLVCLTFYSVFITERYIMPTMKDFGKLGVPFVFFFGNVIDNTLPGIVFLVFSFYGFLHSWHNVMAEIMRFSDRLFYRDWWNATSYAEYYKAYNILVYDWLLTFIYKEAGGAMFKTRFPKAVFVITISALFHDYIAAMTVGFFIPVFTVCYGFGGPLVMQITSRNKTIGNVFIWFTLCLGSGLMVTLYFAEYYARVNCPRIIESDVWDFLTPRMATCRYTSQ